MLSKNVFLNCMGMILVANDIEPKENTTKALYDLMKNDFTDNEFEIVCERICKEEQLYNHYPPAVMFYKYKTNDSDRCSVECQNFLDKVEDYLNLNFVPSFYKEDFLNSLTDNERRAMQGFGGISTLWSDCHRDSMPRSKTSILKDLRESFENNWTIQQKVDTPLIEQQSDPKMVEDVKNLLGNLKIGSQS